MPGSPGSKLDFQFCNDISRIADALEELVRMVGGITPSDFHTSTKHDLIERAKQKVFEEKAKDPLNRGSKR